MYIYIYNHYVIINIILSYIYIYIYILMANGSEEIYLGFTFHQDKTGLVLSRWAGKVKLR